MIDEQWTRDDAALVDLFDLAGDRVLTLGVVQRWTDEQCKQAEEWAAALHFAASDNPEVVVPPIPPHVDALPRLGPWLVLSPNTADEPRPGIGSIS